VQWTGGYAARFQAFFSALSFLRFDGESYPTHLPLTLAVGQQHEDIKREFMADYIKNHKVGLLLTGIVLLTLLKFAIAFSSGYFGRFYFFSPLCVETVRYILIMVCAVGIIVSKLDRKQKILVSVSGVLLIAIGLIPTGHFMTLGALLSIDNAKPKQIRDDARVLMEEYEAKTYFSDQSNQRFFFSEPIPKNRLPPSLQNENLNEVLVLDDYVFLEKFGLRGLFRGFIVFREGSDIWKNEKSIMRLDGCSYCWRIRVIDGLYWYHAVPIEEEIATVAFPLK
jgi:hypothetical protein